MDGSCTWFCLDVAHYNLSTTEDRNSQVDMLHIQRASLASCALTASETLLQVRDWSGPISVPHSVYTKAPPETLVLF